MGRTNIAQFGNYNTPQTYTLAGASSTPLVLGQWWFDFTRIPEANIRIFMGVEHRFVSGASAHVFPQYGLFLSTTNADIPAADLFSVVPVSCQIVTLPPVDTVFRGVNGTATIANPGAACQVVFAVQPNSVTTNIDPTNWAWRSLYVAVNGV